MFLYHLRICLPCWVSLSPFVLTHRLWFWGVQRHPVNVCMSYWQGLWCALSSGIIMLTMTLRQHGPPELSPPLLRSSSFSLLLPLGLLTPVNSRITARAGRGASPVGGQQLFIPQAHGLSLQGPGVAGQVTSQVRSSLGLVHHLQYPLICRGWWQAQQTDFLRGFHVVAFSGTMWKWPFPLRFPLEAWAEWTFAQRGGEGPRTSEP